MLEDVHERLCGVDIERLPYETLVRRYDRPGTFFGNEGDFGPGVFSAADFERLSDLLAGIEGRFILSINDTPEIRQLFARFMIEPVKLKYRLSGKVTPAREMIVSGLGREVDMKSARTLLAEHAAEITKQGAAVEIYFGAHKQTVRTAELDAEMPGCLVCETRGDDDVLIIDVEALVAVKQVEPTG